MPLRFTLATWHRVDRDGIIHFKTVSKNKRVENYEGIVGKDTLLIIDGIVNDKYTDMGGQVHELFERDDPTDNPHKSPINWQHVRSSLTT